jgi:hypothetical protein
MQLKPVHSPEVASPDRKEVGKRRVLFADRFVVRRLFPMKTHVPASCPSTSETNLLSSGDPNIWN